MPLGALVFVALYGSIPSLARFFTTDRAVQQLIEQTALGPPCMITAFGMLFTAFGVCRGADRQQQASVQMLVFYAAGIGLAYYAGVDCGWPRPLLGLWLGNAAAVAAGAAVTMALVCCIRWDAVSRAAAADAHEDASRREAFLQHSVQDEPQCEAADGPATTIDCGPLVLTNQQSLQFHALTQPQGNPASVCT